MMSVLFSDIVIIQKLHDQIIYNTRILECNIPCYPIHMKALMR